MSEQETLPAVGYVTKTTWDALLDRVRSEHTRILLTEAGRLILLDKALAAESTGGRRFLIQYQDQQHPYMLGCVRVHDLDTGAVGLVIVGADVDGLLQQVVSVLAGGTDLAYSGSAALTAAVLEILETQEGVFEFINTGLPSRCVIRVRKSGLGVYSVSIDGDTTSFSLVTRDDYAVELRKDTGDKPQVLFVFVPHEDYMSAADGADAPFSQALYTALATTYLPGGNTQ